MKLMSAAAATALVLTDCTASTARVPLAPAAIAEVNRACATLAEVDLARLPRTMPDWTGIERFHQRARAGVDFPEGEGAATVLKLAIPGGSIPAPYGISVYAARQADGSWRASHVRYLQLPPPPQPPGASSQRPPQQRIVTNGIVRPRVARLIDAALASDCLKREPFLSPPILPMRSGDVQCPPDGGQDNALEIIVNGQSRRYLRQCGRLWASGAIIVALEAPPG